MLLFSMIKTVFSVFTPRQVARSLGDLSIYYSCQFWKLATLNQTRDICFCTNLASQHRKLRRENIYIPFDQITQVGIILSHRSIPPFTRMPYSQPHNTSRRDYKACSLLSPDPPRSPLQWAGACVIMEQALFYEPE